MTIDGAIKMLEKAKYHDMTIFDMDAYHKALDMAIDALKSKQAQLNACKLIEEIIDYKKVAENIG